MEKGSLERKARNILRGYYGGSGDRESGRPASRNNVFFSVDTGDVSSLL